ncbi:unnamed protein product [Pedinophyceae sp. YPF-701]|nr:unnamed protein product [Pedinophyceae sp. YPF-701]
MAIDRSPGVPPSARQIVRAGDLYRRHRATVHRRSNGDFAIYGWFERLLMSRAVGHSPEDPIILDDRDQTHEGRGPDGADAAAAPELYPLRGPDGAALPETSGVVVNVQEDPGGRTPPRLRGGSRQEILRRQAWVETVRQLTEIHGSDSPQRSGDALRPSRPPRLGFIEASELPINSLADHGTAGGSMRLAARGRHFRTMTGIRPTQPLSGPPRAAGDAGGSARADAEGQEGLRGLTLRLPPRPSTSRGRRDDRDDRDASPPRVEWRRESHGRGGMLLLAEGTAPRDGPVSGEWGRRAERGDRSGDARVWPVGGGAGAFNGLSLTRLVGHRGGDADNAPDGSRPSAHAAALLSHMLPPHDDLGETWMPDLYSERAGGWVVYSSTVAPARPSASEYRVDDAAYAPYSPRRRENAQREREGRERAAQEDGEAPPVRMLVQQVRGRLRARRDQYERIMRNRRSREDAAAAGGRSRPDDAPPPAPAAGGSAEDPLMAERARAASRMRRLALGSDTEAVSHAAAAAAAAASTAARALARGRTRLPSPTPCPRVRDACGIDAPAADEDHGGERVLAVHGRRLRLHRDTDPGDAGLSLDEDMRLLERISLDRRQEHIMSEDLQTAIRMAEAEQATAATSPNSAGVGGGEGGAADEFAAWTRSRRREARDAAGDRDEDRRARER